MITLLDGPARTANMKRCTSSWSDGRTPDAPLLL